MSALLTALTAVALAADPVVHGDLVAGDTAVAKVKAELEVEPTLEPLPMGDLLAGSPSLVEGGQVDVCIGGDAVSNHTVASLLATGESHFLYGEYDQAQSVLADAEGRIPCLQEVVDVRTSARIAYIRGVAAHHAGDVDGATAAFRRAFAQLPSLAWDDDLPTGSKALFETLAAEEPGGIGLEIVAPAERMDVWLDGRKAESTTLVTSPGSHVVQLKWDGPIHTVRVEVGGSNKATLVVPAAFPADSYTWVGDTDKRRRLSILLASHLGEARRAYVVVGDEVWGGTTGRTDWQRVGAPTTSVTTGSGDPDDPGLDVTGGRRRNPAGIVLISTGAAIAAGGAGFTGWSYASLKSADTDYCNATTADEARNARQRFDSAATRMQVLPWVAAGGGVLLVTGIIVHVATKPKDDPPTTSLAPWIGPHGGGAVLTFRPRRR